MPPLNPLGKSCVALAVGQLLLAPSLANAAIITVNSHTDNDAGCTLREAILSANTSTSQNNGCAIGSNSGTDTITFSNSLVSNTISLENGELSIDAGKDIEINASAIPGGITVDANQSSRAILIDSAVVTLNSMRLTGGLEQEDANGSYNYGDLGIGGAIFAMNSTLTLNNTTVTDNSAELGTGIGVFESDLNLINSAVDNNTAFGEDSELVGAIVAQSSNVTLNNSSISNNTSAGGIFFGDGSLTINSSRISGNSAFSYAGGIIFAAEQNLTINSSTISGNSASSGVAGAIAFIASESSLILNNSTLSGNSGTYAGGLIFGGAELIINNSTLSDNSASGDSTGELPAIGGIALTDGNSVSLNNSIIANSVGYDCFNLEQLYQPYVSSPAIVDGATIIEDGSCGANRSGDPGLLPLADNNGPTQTHALSTDSIARNSSVGDCLLTDQRGQTRDISDGFCDVGAVEFDPSLVNEPTTFVIPLPNGKTVIFDL